MVKASWSSDMWQEELERSLAPFDPEQAAPEFFFASLFSELNNYSPGPSNLLSNGEQQPQHPEQQPEQPQPQQQKLEQKLDEMEVERHGTSAALATREEPTAFQNWCDCPPLLSVACVPSAASATLSCKDMRKWILEVHTAEHEKSKRSCVKQETNREDEQLPTSDGTDTAAQAQILTNSSYNHKMAERHRRKMEAEHLSALKTFIPPSKKKDKVSTLKACVHHIQELVSKVNSLKKEGPVATIPDCIQFIQDLVHRVDTLEKKLNSGSSAAEKDVSKSPDHLSALIQEQEESSSTWTSQESRIMSLR